MQSENQIRTNVLKRQLETLATAFADALVDAFCGVALGELGELDGASPPGAKGAARRPRGATSAPAPRTGGASAGSGGLLALLRRHPDGLRAEQIRAEIGVDKAELTRLLKGGLAAKQLKKRGAARATTYFVTGK